VTPPLWSYSDLVAVTGARLVGQPSATVRGVSIDSRTVHPGDLFVAIRGENFDGHDFARAALDRGAGAALVAEDRLASLDRRGPWLAVPDPLEAMVKLGIAARDRTGARIVAVTGSVGKTGTKEMLRAMFGASGPTHASVASYNNHWGVPLTLARMPVESAFGVFEIGMNHAGEITPLVGYVRPEVAIVTTVEAVHLEFFPNVGGIAEAKAEIFSGLEPGGAALINRDNRYWPILKARAEERGARIVLFGEHADAECRLLGGELAPDSSSVRASIFGQRIAYSIGAPGRHVVQNSLAALGAAALVGADLERAAASLAGTAAPKGRGARETLVIADGTFTLIDESYNANPASMRAAIALLGDVPVAKGGRRIAVLGDMRELGATADELHAELATPIEAARLDLVHCCGPHMIRLWERLPETRRGAYADAAPGIEAQAIASVRAGDAVMVKGSLGTRMGPIVDAFRKRFAPAGASGETR
jgi:UDP-N-acetylmuramoyl-tripeptide--D-alanyl-D-alanine ligase